MATFIKGLNGHRKNFADMLKKFSSYGYSSFKIFEDFLAVSSLVLANNCDPFYLVNAQSVVEERELRYKKIITQYEKDLQPLFINMFTEIVLELENCYPDRLTDVLGELFHELNFHDKWKGQFFTPQEVSDFMAKMIFTDYDSMIKSKGFISINDPCCGGGSLLLGAANGMRAVGYNPSNQLFIVASDIDERCVHMCYVQLSLYGLPAVVQQMNALTQESCGDPWYTPVCVFDNWVFRLRSLLRNVKND